MKPAKKPNDPRKMFLKIPFGPHLVINEVSHPLSAPIAIPAMAHRTSAKTTTIRGTGSTWI
jgi:hypothetical protein